MKMPDSSVLYGIFAKNAQGRARLAHTLPSCLPSTFPAFSSQWFVAPQVGLALFGAQSNTAATPNTPSALSMLGTHYGDKPATGLNLADFCQYGSSQLARINGEFVALFWDGARGQLLLARDHLGQRDLFIREDADCYVVCSELAPLLADPEFACELDFASAVHYLSFGSPVPGHTLARGVSRVPAAHYLLWNGSGPLLSHRFYTPLSYDSAKVLDLPATEELAVQLDAAITERIVPGRQAILLSGGVDSSYVAMTAAQAAGGSNFDAYTVEFSAPFPHNEGQYANIVTEEAGITHHRVELSPSQAVHALHHVLGAAQPCSAWASMTHHHLLTQIRADGHSHLLSGMGADEVFGGYWKYFQAYVKQRRFDETWPVGEQIDSFDGLQWLPTQARARLFAGIPRFFSDAAQRAAFAVPYSAWNHSAYLVEFYRECRNLKHNAHLFEVMVAHECQHRVPDLLFAGFESLGRQHGMRTAYPFLAPNITTQACALGASERFWIREGRWRNKKVLREIAGARVPDAIMKRPLHSYTAPIVLWLKEPAFAERIFSLLHDSALWETGIVSAEWRQHVEHEVRQLGTDSKSKKFTYVEQLWVLVTLAAWYDRWVKRTS